MYSFASFFFRHLGPVVRYGALLSLTACFLPARAGAQLPPETPAETTQEPPQTREEGEAALAERQQRSKAQLARLELTWLEPLERPRRGGEVPPTAGVLARELKDDTVVSVAILRGTLRPDHGPRRSFVLWAAHSDAVFLGEQRCYDDWDAVQLFVGSNGGLGEGAPWVDDNADFTLCSSEQGARVEVQGSPERDPNHWGDVNWSGPVEVDQVRRDVLDGQAQVPPSLLPTPYWPSTWDYETGETPPPGYTYHEAKRWNLTIIGGSVFSVLYLGPLIISTVDNGRPGPYAVPVVGPFLGWAQYIEDTRCPPDAFCEGSMADVLVPIGLILDGLGQAATLGLAIAGPLLTRRWYERDAEEQAGSWTLGPLAVRRGTGLSFRMAF